MSWYQKSKIGLSQIACLPYIKMPPCSSALGTNVKVGFIFKSSSTSQVIPLSSDNWLRASESRLLLTFIQTVHNTQSGSATCRLQLFLSLRHFESVAFTSLGSAFTTSCSARLEQDAVEGTSRRYIPIKERFHTAWNISQHLFHIHTYIV